MILSPVVQWVLTSACLAVGLVVLIAWKRWHETAVNEFSEQVLQLTRDEGTAGRIGLEGKSEALGDRKSVV